jgi:hypothetical protein
MFGNIARICVDDDASTPVLLKWSNADYCINNNTNIPPQVKKKVINKKDNSVKYISEDRVNKYWKASSMCSQSNVCG